MKGIDVLSVVSGIVFTLGGIALLIVSLFFWPAIFYAVPVLIIGIVILATLREQERIEEVKVRKGKK